MTQIVQPKPVSRSRNLWFRLTQLENWAYVHRVSLLTVIPLLAIVGLAHGINFDGWPARFNDDEGTYAAQAWAVLTKGELAHYTYWYDHPPLGWITIAGYALLTGGFDRADTAVTMAREVMMMSHVISAALIFMLMRRLQFSRVGAVVAVLLFSLSPLSMLWQRMAFLDNLAVMWVLAAFVLAASPRRTIASAFGSAVCLTAAVLTKETAGILLPALLIMLWQRHPKGSRSWALMLFTTSFLGLSFLYILYAILKNELFEGPGHVSLLWALKWQLHDRASTGSLFDANSVTFALVKSWFDVDPWLLGTGVALVVPAMFVARLLAVTTALAIQLILMVRGGYLPQAYIITLLPFMALVVAGSGEVFWKSRLFKLALNQMSSRLGRLRLWFTRGVNRIGAVLTIVTALTIGVLAGPSWGEAAQKAAMLNPSGYSKQATQWVLANVSHDATIIVDDNIWTDLQMAGYKNQVWLYKVDLDPTVQARYFPHGYQSVDYVVLLQLPPSILEGLPIVKQAIDHSDIVATFGDGNDKLVLRKVHK